MWIFAHRGDSAHAPENTLAAFKAAIPLADGIEFDVHLSADGVPVVIHDDSVARTTRGGTGDTTVGAATNDTAGQVGELTVAQLQALDAGSWRDAQFAGERIPTLEALCALMAPTGLQLNLELKTRPNPYPGIEAAVHACLQRYDLLARTVISSFNWDSLERMRALDAELRLGLLCSRPADWSARADALGAWSLHPQHPYVDADLVHEAHAHRLVVLAWTVNKPADGARLAALGVDGLITDDPGALRA